MLRRNTSSHRRSSTASPRPRFHSHLPQQMVAIPLFLNVGNHVLILEGASEGGARGTINELMPDYALVTLDEDNRLTFEQDHPYSDSSRD